MAPEVPNDRPGPAAGRRMHRGDALPDVRQIRAVQYPGEDSSPASTTVRSLRASASQFRELNHIYRVPIALAPNLVCPAFLSWNVADLHGLNETAGHTSIVEEQPTRNSFCLGSRWSQPRVLRGWRTAAEDRGQQSKETAGGLRLLNYRVAVRTKVGVCDDFPTARFAP